MEKSVVVSPTLSHIRGYTCCPVFGLIEDGDWRISWFPCKELGKIFPELRKPSASLRIEFRAYAKEKPDALQISEMPRSSFFRFPYFKCDGETTEFESGFWYWATKAMETLQAKTIYVVVRFWHV